MTTDLKKLPLLLVLCFTAIGSSALAQKMPHGPLFQPVKPDQIAVPQQEPDPAIPAYAQTLSGNYLSSMFAQRHHDWNTAKIYLGDLLKQNPDDPQLLKRAMILAIGSGQINTGLEFADRVLKVEPSNALASLFLAAGAFHDKKYADAEKYISQMPKDSLSEFLVPLMKSWAQAALGKNDITGLDKNIIHINHAVMIADYLGQYDQLNALLEKALKNPEITTGDIMIVADIYAHTGNKDKALELYEKARKDFPDEPAITEKIAALKAGKSEPMVAKVKTAEQGVAAALLDMARLLYQEYSDDSARVFAHLALYLNPSLIDADLLLGSVTARNERYDEAIDYYRKVQPDSPYFLESRRKAADLLLDAGRKEEALNELSMLARDQDDIESLIRVGDIYRQDEQFDKALEVYNEAAAKLGAKIPAEYWYLYYVRGISYERSGQWDKAEKDLKTALTYQPDHPYVLNYLGYAWADHGLNLKQALEMVSKASSLMPDDGYITDSLGWIYYKMEQYKEAAPILEKAVQLLPHDPVINDHLGDVYWQIGRKREAKFQWYRARNFTVDDLLKKQIARKIDHGMDVTVPVKEAHTQVSPDPAAEKTVTP